MASSSQQTPSVTGPRVASSIPTASSSSYTVIPHKHRADVWAHYDLVVNWQNIK